MSTDPVQVRPGMEVMDSSAERVGRVTEVHEDGFLVERTSRSAIAIPFDAVQGLASDRVMLNLDARQLDSLDRPAPPAATA